MATSLEKRCVSHGFTMGIFACRWPFQAIDARMKNKQSGESDVYEINVESMVVTMVLGK